ncbi:unnamed protein product [Effrenium voratum]|nr:unnamed protein product [Effrenium voratum]
MATICQVTEQLVSHDKTYLHTHCTAVGQHVTASCECRHVRRLSRCGNGMDCPRGVANPGQWCWFNALLQALASINDPRWWNILRFASEVDTDGAYKDTLACLSGVLLYLNRESDSAAVHDLAIAIQSECGISSCSGEQQDAHEALVQLLEALHHGLLRRQQAAFRWPLWLWGAGTKMSRATQALRDFQELWQGVLEERRVCMSCGLVRVESSPTKQAFRCLSLDLMRMDQPHLSSVELTNLLSAHGKPEEIEGLICSRCSLAASQRSCAQEALRGSLLAGQACARLSGFAEAKSDPDVEALEVLRLAGTPLTMQRTTHLRRFLIKTAPQIFSFHLRRLVFGPFGLVKLPNVVRYPPVLKTSETYALAAVVSHLGPATEGHFVTHRAWNRTNRSFLEVPAVPAVPLDVAGQVKPWSPVAASLGFLRPGRGMFARTLQQEATRVWVCANDDDVCEAPSWQVLKESGVWEVHAGTLLSAIQTSELECERGCIIVNP